ncbi:MAG TPA: sulfotransferase [Pseudomonadales bacterium]|nr:sulfotransferase [Pseudomonadales bacterium]
MPRKKHNPRNSMGSKGIRMAFDHRAHGMQPPLIHIGFPKAMSSWLQKFLFQPEQGFINILDSLRTTISVIDPSPFTFDESASKAFIEETLRNTPHHSQLVPVCSAEALVGNYYCGGFNAKQNADRLKQLFPEAKILLIVREQRSLMRSLYKTMVVWGMPHSIKRLLSPQNTSLVPQFHLDFLRFDLITAYYQTLFGRENILVLPYEAFPDNPHGFVQKILTHANCKATPAFAKLPWKRKLNKNQPLINIYFQRLKNILLATPFNYVGPLAQTETRIATSIKNSKKNGFPAFTHTWFEDDFNQIVSQAFRGEFSASNQRLELLTGLDLRQYGYGMAENYDNQ